MSLTRLQVTLVDPATGKGLMASTDLVAADFEGGLAEALAHAMQNSLDQLVAAVTMQERASALPKGIEVVRA